jgi:carboxypeptidase Q
MKTRACILCCAFVAALSFAFGQDQADVAMVTRIWQEGVDHSEIMRTLSYLTDVIGPRIPGSPAMKKAYDYATKRFGEFGMKNIAVESSGEFGLGWQNEYISVHMTAPAYQAITAFPVPWTGGTNGKISGSPLMVKIGSKADFDRYRGKLKGAIVLTQDPRATRPVFIPPATRLSEERLRNLVDTPVPVKPKPSEDQPPGLSWLDLQDFFRSEGVGVLVESSSPSRADYGTVKVDAYSGNGKDHVTPGQPAKIMMAAEHYARICRIMDMNVPVTLEVEVRSTFYDQDRQGYNVVAEMPGTDKRDELVMLGGHMDSWAGGTGAVDDAAGCAVAMEALRILNALGVNPRRTIRVALWTGEEEGFYGSRGYVVRHFGDTDQQSLASINWDAYEKNWRNPLGNSKKIIAKPEYHKISGYFNYDNGTGKIRGIYIEENLQLKPIFEEWMKPLHELGVSTIATRGTGGTDHEPFEWIGIPGFQFIQDPIDYMPNLHHTNQDIYDHCVPEDLIQSAIVMAAFVYHTAMRDQMLPRKPPRIPVEVKESPVR